MKKADVNSVETETLQRLKALICQKATLRTFTLFGSRAQGDADPDSDMDVLVVVERLDEEIANHVSQWRVGSGF